MDHAPARLRRATANRGNLPRIAQATETRPAQPHLLRHWRAFRRIAYVLLFLPIAVTVQGVLLLLDRAQKVTFPAFFWATISRMLGLHVRTLGTPIGAHRNAAGRPVIYVCNHSSWLDIPAIGGEITGCFVAKDDVAGWPVISTVARLGRTIFVSRNRGATLRERDEMQAALAAGDDLILFPEGTSSDGSRVLPFRSSFFAAAYGDAKPLIQPVSVVYDRLAGLPVTHASRTVFSWYGDMTLAPHVWQVAQWSGKRASLLFHRPLDPADFADRKALAAATWQVVADGAAVLRQNRFVATPAAETVPAAPGQAAFA